MLQATDEEQALALATRLQQAGLMRAFGTVQQLPKRIYTIDELRLNKIEPERLLSPRDDSLAAVRTTAQVAAALGLGSLAYVAHWDAGQVLGTLVGGVFVLWCDQVANGGGGEALLIDTLGRLLRPQYAKRVAMHEAGHFLVAYLMGLLPKAYTLSSLDAFRTNRALNIQVRCAKASACRQQQQMMMSFYRYNDDTTAHRRVQRRRTPGPPTHAAPCSTHPCACGRT